MSLCATGIPVSGIESPLRDTLVRRARLGKAFPGFDGDERVERTVQFRGAIEEEFGQLCARDFLLRERGGKFLERGVQHPSPFTPSPIQVLLNDFRNEIQTGFDLRRDRLESSRWSPSVTASSRRAQLRSWPWDIGATPSVSTFCILPISSKMSLSWT